MVIVGMIAALGGLLSIPRLVMNAFHAERPTRDHVPITETICAYIRESANRPRSDVVTNSDNEKVAAKRLKIKNR